MGWTNDAVCTAVSMCYFSAGSSKSVSVLLAEPIWKGIWKSRAAASAAVRPMRGTGPWLCLWSILVLSDIVNFIIKGLTVTIQRSLVWPAVRVDSFGWPAHRSRERRTWPRSSFHVPRSGTGTGTFREQFSVKILHKRCSSFRERSGSGNGSGNMATRVEGTIVLLQFATTQ